MNNVQLAATQIVQQVLVDGRNLNQALSEIQGRKNAWAQSQRSALQDLSYGTLRHYGHLEAILKLLLQKPLTDRGIHHLLLVALYQLQYSKAPSHAVVDHAVRSAKSLSVRMSGLVNATLRNFLRNREALLEQATRTPEGRFSYPSWWIDELKDQYGARAEEILAAGNQHPPMTLRVNHLACSTEDYMALLSKNELSAKLIEPGALMLVKPVPVEKLPGFFEGLVSVQDAGAQYAANLLDISDGMRVLDACAAPGGKTSHMLELAKVEMIALEMEEVRMKKVADNLKRLKLHAQLIVGDASLPEIWWDGKPFHRILADVPCSASGVVRRHPDIKWLRRHADLEGFASRQTSILNSLWRLLELDGKLLYATCSFFKQENELVIKAFLARTPDAVRLPVDLPGNLNGQLLSSENHDGFFYALLQKTA